MRRILSSIVNFLLAPKNLYDATIGNNLRLIDGRKEETSQEEKINQVKVEFDKEYHH